MLNNSNEHIMLNYVLNMFSRVILKIIALRRNRIVALCCHRVLPELDPLRPHEMQRDEFEYYIKALSKMFDFIDLNDLFYLRKRPKAEKKYRLLLTFDDGYRDNLTVVAPILQKYKLPAIIFSTTAFCNGGSMWNDCVIEAIRIWPDDQFRHDELKTIGNLSTMEAKCHVIRKLLQEIKYLPPIQRTRVVNSLCDKAALSIPNLMLTEADLATLNSYAEITLGGHTHSHPILAQNNDYESKREIQINKYTLEAILGAPITAFAYPNGKYQTDFDERHLRMLMQSGYQSAFTTDKGSISFNTDLFRLPRISPWSKHPNRFSQRITFLLMNS